ncbi:MAG: DUF4126 domain-containing protein [Vulcanimicrobiaceae bacterium]
MDAATFATAYALSTSVGLRPFVTLALASLAMHFGYLHPSTPFAALGSDGATAVLALLALLELLGDKLPLVDHALHVLHFAAKPLAAAILVGSIVPDAGTPLDGTTMALAALNAVGVHTAVATLRAGSTTMTLGMANPLLSLAEDGAAAAGVGLALVAPYVGAVLAALLTLTLLLVARSGYLALARARRSLVPRP